MTTDTGEATMGTEDALATTADDLPPGTTGSERLSALAQQHGALVTLVIAMIIASLAFDTFLTGDNLENMALSSAFLAVVALGMTFVIVTGGIDLSVGSLFALAGSSPHGVRSTGPLSHCCCRSPCAGSSVW